MAPVLKLLHPLISPRDYALPHNSSPFRPSFVLFRPSISETQQNTKITMPCALVRLFSFYLFYTIFPATPPSAFSSLSLLSKLSVLSIRRNKLVKGQQVFRLYK